MSRFNGHFFFFTPNFCESNLNINEKKQHNSFDRKPTNKNVIKAAKYLVWKNEKKREKTVWQQSWHFFSGNPNGWKETFHHGRWERIIYNLSTSRFCVGFSFFLFFFSEKNASSSDSVVLWRTFVGFALSAIIQIESGAGSGEVARPMTWNLTC